MNSYSAGLMTGIDSAAAASATVTTPDSTRVSNPIDRALAGERLGRDEILELYSLPAEEVRAVAHEMRLRKVNRPLVTYSLYGNIDYTNVCSVGCKFCCYFRGPRAEDAFVLSHDEIAGQIAELRDSDIHNILLMGGINPNLPFEWYVEMLRRIKEVHPGIWIDAFSPEEIIGFERLTGRTAADLLAELKAAGMDALPGVSAEILDDEIRHAVAPNRIGTADWLRIVEAAFDVGLEVPCVSMVFGMGETNEHRADHMLALRDLQDRMLAKHGRGVQTFEVWPMRLQHSRLRDSAPTSDPDEIAYDYLHHLAVGRLVMDNIDNHRTVWRTMGFGIARQGLLSGADECSGTGTINAIVAVTDLDGRVIDDGPGAKEDILADIHGCIRDAGFTPARRGPDWRIMYLDTKDGPAAYEPADPGGAVDRDPARLS